MLESRKEGTSVFYRVRDPRALQLHEVARQILTSSLEATHALLTELADAPTGGGGGAPRGPDRAPAARGG